MKQLSGLLLMIFAVILLIVNAFSDHRGEASYVKGFLRHGRPAKDVAYLDDNFLFNLKEDIKRILHRGQHKGSLYKRKH